MTNTAQPNTMQQQPKPPLIVVTGATGKVGARVMARLERLGVGARSASRSTPIPFNWNQPGTWPALLAGADAAFISYAPDVGFPGAAATIGAFAACARAAGVQRLVLLSGRGEPGAAHSEAAMRAAGVACCVLRCSWFAQNFSEHFLHDAVLNGVIALPAGEVAEPFVDLDDVADIAVTCLTQPGHTGRTYELTGPAALTFSQVAEILSTLTGRRVDYIGVTADEYACAAVDAGLPAEEAHALAELFAAVLDGRNAHVCHDVPELLGRPATSFEDYAQRTAASGVWDLAVGRR